MEGIQRLCLCLSLMVLLGCGATPGGIYRAYEGEREDTRDISVLDWTAEWKNSRLMVTHIDGTYLHETEEAASDILTTVAHLLPGKHLIEFSHSWVDLYYNNRIASFITLSGRFRPGHSYAISEAPCKGCKPFSVVFLLQDATTTEIIDQRTVTGVVPFGYVNKIEMECIDDSGCQYPRANAFSESLSNKSRARAEATAETVLINMPTKTASLNGRLATVSVRDKRPPGLSKSMLTRAFGAPRAMLSFTPPEAEIVENRLEFQLNEILRRTGVQSKREYLYDLMEFRVFTRTTMLHWDVVAQIRVSSQQQTTDIELSGESTTRTYVPPTAEIVRSVVDDALEQVVTGLQAPQTGYRQLH